MKTLKSRLDPHSEDYGALNQYVDESAKWTESQIAERAIVIELERTMKVSTEKVGRRNREKSASTVELLFDWDTLLDPEGDFYAGMTSKGITLEHGEDYLILDSDGNPITLKSGPEKVRRLIVIELAERLNVPTSVKVPDTGASVASDARDWVSFRPRMATPFADDKARAEYIEKNGGEFVPEAEAPAADEAVEEE
jgi:hypothetical protein